MMSLVSSFFIPFEKTTITYIIIIDEDVELNYFSGGYFSPLQGFSKGILNLCGIYRELSKLPASVEEFFMNRKEIVCNKLNFDLPRRILVIGSHSLEIFHEMYKTDFSIIISPFSNKNLYTFINECFETNIFVKYSEINKLTREMIYKKFKLEISKYIKGFAKKLHPLNIKSIKFLSHNIFAPNIYSLMNIGIHGKISENYTTGDYNEACHEQLSLINEVNKFIHLFSETQILSLIISCPSMLRGWYRNKDYYQRYSDIEKNTNLNIIKKTLAILRNQKYFSFEIDSLKFKSKEELYSFLFSPIIRLRKMELSIYTEIIANFSSNCFAPVLRLPPGCNGIRYDLIRFSNCARGQGQHKDFKLENIRKNISKSLFNIIGHELYSIIEKTSGHIKIFADVPIEFLNIGNLPLNIKNSCSRIPTSAGNMLLHKTLQIKKMYIQKSHLRKILIIRSFNKSDPIRNILYNTIKLFLPSDNTLDIAMIDVSISNEFISVLKRWEYPILIYDGHGGLEGTEGLSTLRIGDENFDMFAYRDKIVIPPIVILSACDTYPVDGCHASAANSFFMCGAKTVLGTFNAINAKKAAIFISRLLLRLTPIYLDICLEHGIYSWNNIVHGLIQMQYASDLILNASKIFKIHDNEVKNLLLFSNMQLNPLSNTEWYDNIIKAISETVKIDKNDVHNEILKKFIFSESTSYVQLGYPELIYITPDDGPFQKQVISREL